MEVNVNLSKVKALGRNSAKGKPSYRLQKTTAFHDIIALRHRSTTIAFIILADFVGLEEVSLVLLSFLLFDYVILTGDILSESKLLQDVLIVFELLFELDSLLLSTLLATFTCSRLRVHRELVLLNVELLITILVIGTRHNSSEASKMSVLPSDLLSPCVMLVKVNLRLGVVIVVLIRIVVVGVPVVLDSLQKSISDSFTILLDYLS